MTDLSGKIEGALPEKIAYYFSCDVDLVNKAINQGAKTYQDVYNFININRCEGNERE